MRIEALTTEEITRIHDAALQVLENVGLALPSSSPLADRLRKAGLEIGDDDRLRLAPATVRAAIERAPRVVRLGARDPNRTAVLDRSRSYLTTDGCGSRTIDLESGQIRPSTLADVADSARLTDALDAYDVYWSMVSANDIPTTSRVPREYLTALQNTTKPVQMIDVAYAWEARSLVKMAREIEDAGVIDGPAVSILIAVVSPLKLDPEATEAALEFSAAGLPVMACSMPISSVSSPATPEALILVTHAELLAFTTLIQTLHPGAPVVYCAFPSFADARTGIVNYADPRAFWASAASAQMGRYLDQPCFTNCDQASLLVAPDLLGGGGLLHVSTLLSFEELVLSDAQLSDQRISTAQQPVSEERLALDVIREVGPGGHFMAHKHSIAHIREFTTPRFVEPEYPGERKTDPGGAWEQARAEAQRLLRSHRIEPLSSEIEARLEAIVAINTH